MSRGAAAWTVIKTIAFLLAFWAIVLFAVPIGISVLEVNAGIQRFPPLPRVAESLLVIATVVAVWSALTLAVAGRGTPLALDPPRELVTTGPYSFVRHPFAAASTAQIVALGLALGSIPVLLYAATAMAAWYFLVRPREERALEVRFGPTARTYHANVRGFRPRRRPFVDPGVR